MVGVAWIETLDGSPFIAGRPWREKMVAQSDQSDVPGVTTRFDVAWWVQNRLLEMGVRSSFGISSPYVACSRAHQPECDANGREDSPCRRLPDLRLELIA